MNSAGKQSYSQILKSSALIGGSAVLNAGFAIVRTKAMALLIGPSGVGLLGLYGSIFDLARTIAGMGVDSSGVRQIAEAVGTGDSQRIAQTVTALRRVAPWLGALSVLLVVVLCKPVSRLTFGDDHHAGGVALLSLAVFFGVISAAQGALVQGMRRISDLARLSVLGAFLGTLFSIPLVYFFGQRGVVPSLICVSVVGAATSWWYVRRITVERVTLTLQQVTHEASALLKLGFVLMAGTLMTMVVAYVVRIIVRQKIGMEAVGFYQAAWALGGLYVGFILQAMGADFYPRLTAVANHNAECNRLVNEQAETGILLAVPGLLATLTFAPLVVHLFYSAKFAPAVEMLRWICLGTVLRVATWPMGFVQLAKGEKNLFFWTRFASNAVHVGLVWVGVLVFGVTGAGIAFFGVYIVHWVLIYTVVRQLSGFRWSSANGRLGLLFAPLIAAVFGARYILPRTGEVVLGIVATILASGYSLKTLCSLVPLQQLPRSAQKVIGFLCLAPSNPNV